jgi:hypothetical protein
MIDDVEYGRPLDPASLNLGVLDCAIEQADTAAARRRGAPVVFAIAYVDGLLRVLDAESDGRTAAEHWHRLLDPSGPTSFS